MSLTRLLRPVRIDGTGLHTGAPARAVVCPAPVGTGVRFLREDLGAAAIPARWDHAEQSPLMTRLKGEDGASVATIEHLMAALAGLGISDVLVRLDGPEVPVLDGSAAPFVRALRAGGLTRGPARPRVWRLRHPVEVRRGAAVARLEPYDGVAFDLVIDFPDEAIGRQRLSLDLFGTAFEDDLAEARTFCRAGDIEGMRSRGLALGGSHDNAVVVDGAEVLTPGGWRMGKEAVRHKMLDALGDLALAGRPILGRYVGHRSGHSLTNALLHKVFATPGAIEEILCPASLVGHLPGPFAAEAEARAVA